MEFIFHFGDMREFMMRLELLLYDAKRNAQVDPCSFEVQHLNE